MKKNRWHRIYSGRHMAKTTLARATLSAVLVMLSGCVVGNEEDGTGTTIQGLTAPNLASATFTIGIGFGPANTQAEYTKLKASGFNATSRSAEAYGSVYASSAMLATLNLAAANGMNAAVNDGMFWGAVSTGVSVGAATDAFYTRYATKAASRYWWVLDEPNRTQFASIQTAAARLKVLNSTKIRFVNLLPSIAQCSQLAGTPQGTPCSYSYRSYVHDFLAAAPAVNLFTFDHYPFLVDGRTERDAWFESLEVTRSEGIAAGRDYGTVIQGSAGTAYRNPTKPEMMWQAMTSLAYGAKMVDWFSWTSVSDPNGFVTGFGSSSADRAEVLEVATRLQAFGKYLTKATSEAVWHADSGRPAGTSARPLGDPVWLDNAPMYVSRFSIPNQAGKVILVGNRDFVNRSVASAMICPLTPAGAVWFNTGNSTWSILNPNAAVGQCVTGNIGLDPAEARLYYVN